MFKSSSSSLQLVKLVKNGFVRPEFQVERSRKYIDQLFLIQAILSEILSGPPENVR